MPPSNAVSGGVSRRAFVVATGAAVVGAAVAVSGLGGPAEALVGGASSSGLPVPGGLVRSALVSSALGRSPGLASESELTLLPEHPLARAERPAVRGHLGLTKAWRTQDWRLRITGETRSSVLKLRDLEGLDAVEHITELRGHDGWTSVVHWRGVRLGDVLAPFGQFSTLRASTPDGGYGVTLTAEVASHPQTLLATHLGGQPLDLDHGAPVRLVVPVRPAGDSLKRVATIHLS